MYTIKEDISKWTKEKRIKRLEELYAERIGESLDISNPSRFTEKVQWMKIYYSSPDIIKCIDKISFKDYISSHLGDGFTAKIYKVWKKPEDVSFDGLPPKCVLKSNCSSEGRNIILINDWNNVDKELLLKEIKESWFDKRLLCTNSFITSYHHVEPAVFAEELIPGFDGAYEYKVFCFNGEPKCLYVPRYEFINGIESNDFTVSFYTTNWEFMNCKFGNYEYLSDIEKPKRLQQMLDIAKKIAKDFMFVRVDFVDTFDGLYLSELTFYPSGGLIPFHPIEIDQLIGSWLTIDKSFEESIV